jgi:hypothetical protein
MANLIFNGVSSDSCDYCNNQSNADYLHCFDCTVNTNIIVDWLESYGTVRTVCRVKNLNLLKKRLKLC